MSTVFWTNRDSANDHPATEVDEQHALPVGLYWSEELDEAEAVSAQHPLPVAVTFDVQSGDVRGYVKQVSVATSATLIANANDKRRSIMLTNLTGTQYVIVGFDNGVSFTNGAYLAAAAGSSLTTAHKGAVWAIANTGAQTVTVLEEIGL